MLKQTWESFAIQGEIISSLPDILKRLIQVDLHSLARDHDIGQPDKKSDKEIIARLLKLMADSKKIEEILMIARPDEFDLFIELLDVDFKDIDEMPYESYAYLMEYGIVFSFYYKERRYLLISEEIKSIYRKIDKPVFNAHREKYLLVHKYIKALCNFYGVFEPEQFVDIYNSLNQGRLNIAGFKNIYDRLVSRPQSFFDYGQYILGKYFLNISYDEMDSFIEKIEDKPYYLPDKEELLKRADDFYFEMTPQLKVLRDYIIGNMCRDEKIIESLIKDIELLCFFEQPFHEVIYEFKRKGILFESTRQLNILMPLIANAYNNTRTWNNRGYTANEMTELFGKDAPLIKDIPIEQLDDAIFKKVGRNDPCPCGSGKKYKKCCAR
jgi:hypothetical protein